MFTACIYGLSRWATGWLAGLIRVGCRVEEILKWPLKWESWGPDTAVTFQGALCYAGKDTGHLISHSCEWRHNRETASETPETVQTWHLDLGLSMIQNCEQQTSVVYGPPGLQYSITGVWTDWEYQICFLLPVTETSTQDSHCQFSIHLSHASTVLRNGDTTTVPTCTAYQLPGQQTAIQVT